MNTAILTSAVPRMGASYDRLRPETRAAWAYQRQGGITATDLRDWGQGSKRRAIITEKVTGISDFTSNAYWDHGTHREPMIAAWIEQKFGIAPCNNVYSHPDNPRFLASPDGVSLDPFTGALCVGDVDAALAEIKCSVHDLTPGPMDAARYVYKIEDGTAFDKANYYTQIQWQMFVMNAVMTLFVWERHDGRVDPETGHFTPIAPPEWCWIPRDQEFIDLLVNTLAPRALEEIDAARLAALGDLPPASDLPTEEAILVSQLLAARDAEAVAVAARQQAWEKLKAHYVGEGKPDLSIDAGFAQITVSTTHSTRKVVNEEAMAKKRPALVRDYEKLRQDFTVIEPVSTQRLTVTPRDV
jgi:hypothetical protein